MAEFDIKIDDKAVMRALEQAPKKAAQAIFRSVKRGTDAAHTHAGRIIAKQLGFQVGDAKKSVIKRDPTFATLAGELRASLRRIPLIKFKAQGPQPSRGKGRGVTYRIGGKTKRIPTAFIATVGSHKGVFRRLGRSRLPIVELKGPSVGEVFRNNEDEILRRGAEQVVKEMRRQIGNILESGRG